MICHTGACHTTMGGSTEYMGGSTESTFLPFFNPEILEIMEIPSQITKSQTPIVPLAFSEDFPQKIWERASKSLLFFF